MSFQCDQIIIFVSDIIGYVKSNKLGKVKIQRKLKWSEPSIKSFIQFLNKTGFFIMPIVINVRTILDEVKFCVIDGNNRINAIVRFSQKPFFYFPEIIDSAFSQYSIDCFDNRFVAKLREVSYETISKSGSYSQFCRNNGLADFRDDPQNQPLLDKYDDIFELIKMEVGKININHVRVPFFKFDNLNDEQICEIYEGLNCGGIKLTKQEILASSTSFIRFLPCEIRLFGELGRLIDDYYDCTSSDGEVLEFQRNENADLNLFEILIAFQMFLAKKFDFVDEPGLGTDLELVFRCYGFIVGNDGFAIKIDFMNQFLETIVTICAFIEKIGQELYFSNVSKYMDKYCLKFSKNSLAILITHIYSYFDEIGRPEFVLEIKRIIVYHILMDIIKNKQAKEVLCLYDALKYRGGGALVMNIGLSIVNKTKRLCAPDRRQFDTVIDIIRGENINNVLSRPKARTQISQFKVMVLCSYFNQYVPRNMCAEKKELDHIIPWSCTWPESGELDINRLGNLQLLGMLPNRLKSNGPILDSFIREHKLDYLHYPCESLYKRIVSSENMINVLEYKKMCEERENMYIGAFMGMLW